MRVLVVGGGGREHALCWKISHSSLLEKLYCAPGNAGTAAIAENVDIGSGDIKGLCRFAKDVGIDLTVVGPEAPLAAGIVDEFAREGLLVFGADRRAAELEASKAFARKLMRHYSIPQPRFEVFASYQTARSYLQECEVPVVVKADGLAAGKGSFVCATRDAAFEALEAIMKERRFGAAGDRIVVEEFLQGEEVSYMVITDGETILPLEPAQDFKRAFDGDTGPNTGGMGAYSPPPFFTQKVREEVERRIVVPIIHAMSRQRRSFRGLLYAGLILTEEGPKVLEFNVRFGDPETQPVLMRMEGDLLEVLHLCAQRRLGELAQDAVSWRHDAAVCVVVASNGYPDKYETGFKIKGLQQAEKMEDVVVFHAGTRLEGTDVVTAGGRVLGVTARAPTLHEARNKAYEAVKSINFKAMRYRTDIALRALSL